MLLGVFQYYTFVLHPSLQQLWCCAQDFIETYFPTREIFAPLASYVLRIKPKYAKKIKEFQQKNFRLFNIGMQVCTSALLSLLCRHRFLHSRYYAHQNQDRMHGMPALLLLAMECRIMSCAWDAFFATL